ncbi:MAG TPA: M13 family metallopeptidase [Opitutaceae bacterium]|jgi:predicted metalloendopeptidase
MKSIWLAAALAGALGAHAAIDRSDFDWKVKPADDFYRFVNGHWLKTHPIPAVNTSWGLWDEVEAQRQDALRTLFQRVAYQSEPLAPNDPLVAVERRVGDFYASGMDLPAIQAAGLGPLKRWLEEIDRLQTTAEVAAEIPRLHLISVDVVFSFGSEQDSVDSTRMIAGAAQGGLGLPDRDYYFRNDRKSEAIRRAYRTHIERMLRLSGDAAAAADAEAAWRLELALAKASRSAVDLRDPVTNYHPTAPGALSLVTPHFSWPGYFRNLGMAAPSSVDVSQPEFFAAFDRLLVSTPVADWRAYLRWQLLTDFAPDLSEPFEQEDFDFSNRILTGTVRERDRWKRVMDEVDNALPQDVGHLYVYTQFSVESKSRALAMIAEIRRALRERLAVLPWMDAPTRQRAIAKLDAMTVKVGYPDHWIDYGSVAITRTSYLDNILNAQRFGVRRDLNKIGRPVDRAEWDADPSEVNAFYETNLNDIVFPAGVLQAPLFDRLADDALNYGGIGTVMGHEMTHGFDDQGRLYDGKGNLSDWWTPESAARFEERSKRIVKQFDRFVALDDLHVNGELTEGENIADLGGLKLAYSALHHVLTEHGVHPSRTDGFTADQRFFIAFARLWRENTRPEELRLLVTTDPHSPSRYRVNGPLSNLPEFYDAFSIPPGAPMRQSPDQRVEIW